MKTEPSVGFLMLVGGLAALALAAVPLTGRWLSWHLRAPLLAFAVIAGGFAHAGYRAHSVAAPVLEYRYYGAIEGRILKIDRSASGAVRLTLDEVHLGRIPAWKTPQRVRISLHGRQDWLRPQPGQRVMMTGHLSPPQSPAEPGGFDFRRMAWFDRLGAVGYTRNPALAFAPPEALGWRLRLYDLRLAISRAITRRMPELEGGFAAAIVTGDRSGLNPEAVEDLRHSNLAHLLAISGLHMGMLTGAVFFGLRLVLALSTRLSNRYAVKKWAALGALLAAFVYLHISGASVATERAFIMVALMLVAVCLDRRAISLRAVAIAALCVLVLRPESVVGAGFQMSFAATTALVVVFSSFRGGGWHVVPKWARGAAGVALSSAIAGLATAPFAAAHFNIFASYGLIANLAAVPAMGLVVMPGALVALVLAPLGLEGVGLWAMEQGIAWILWVARSVSGLEGAVRAVPMPPGVVLPLIVLGGLWLMLETTRWRFAGLAPVCVALVLWSGASRPEILVSPSGALVGVMTPEGRAVSKERGEGFTARSWLENDGDLTAQAQAYERPGFVHMRARSDLDAARHGLRLIQLRGKGAPEIALRECRGETLILSLKPIEGAFARCTLIDAHAFRQTGALALHQTSDGWQLMTSADVTGERLWTPRQWQTGPREVIASGPLFPEAQVLAGSQ